MIVQPTILIFSMKQPTLQLCYIGKSLSTKNNLLAMFIHANKMWNHELSHWIFPNVLPKINFIMFKYVNYILCGVKILDKMELWFQVMETLKHCVENTMCVRSFSHSFFLNEILVISVEAKRNYNDGPLKPLH